MTMSARRIRVLIGKPGLDGHDRGAKVVARALRDAGMEVVYTGLHQSPAEIVSAAIEEDVDVIGLSLLSGAHMTLVPAVLDKLAQEGAQDIGVLVGGIIPPEDVLLLKAKGIIGVFGPGTPTDAIVEAVSRAAADAAKQL